MEAPRGLGKLSASRTAELRQIIEAADDAPGWFANLVADLMIEYGPDGHCDGYEIIAAAVWSATHEPRR